MVYFDNEVSDFEPAPIYSKYEYDLLRAPDSNSSAGAKELEYYLNVRGRRGYRLIQYCEGNYIFIKKVVL